MDREWNNPMITGVDRVLTHAPWDAYGDAAAARQGVVSGFSRCLNGVWEFTLTQSPEDIPEGFPAGAVGPAWIDMVVPSNWQLDQRVDDQPIYTNMPYPFEGVAPMVPEINPTGWYRTRFSLPDSWSGREIFLHFASCDSACKVWINGTEAGYSEDSKLPHEFNITPLVRAGENTLAVMVPRYCTGFWLECQDYWHLSGIQRDVMLYAKPVAHIRDYVVQTRFDADYCDAELFVSVHMNERPDLADGYAVELELWDPADQAVAIAPASAAISAVSPMYGDTDPERGAARFRIPVQEPDQWTAETPSLYTLVMTLRNPAGDAVDFERCRVGFRQVEIRDGIILLNGRRLVFRGVNDHEHHPERGRALTEDDMREELLAMKRLNFNAVRTCHYPRHNAFYDLCDELGMYVVDEANLETHGIQAQITKDPLWMNAFMERAQRMALRDRNHPSVVAWSLGNESFHGPHHAAMAAWLRQLDPTRPVQYESGFPGQAITDIMAPMYPGLDWIEEILSDPAEKRPLVMCEYAYSKGNALGNFFKYWDLVDRLPRFQGGFIWDWRDKALLRDVDGNLEWAYGNEFDGGIGPDGYDYGAKENPQMCLNGVVNPDLTPKPGAGEVKKIQAPVAFTMQDSESLGCGRVTVWNKYHSLDLSHLELVWDVTMDGVVIEHGVLPMPQVAAGDKACIEIPFGQPEFKSGGEYWLNLIARQPRATAWSEPGHKVAWEQFALQPREAEHPVSRAGRAETDRVSVENTDGRLIVTGADFAVVFEQGGIASWQTAGRELLSRPLEHCFMRARTDNDYIIGNPDSYYREWVAAGLDRLRAEVVDCTSSVRTDGAAAVRCVTLHCGAQDANAITCITDYTVRGDGRLVIACEVDASALTVTTLPRIGMRMGIVPGNSRLTWYGRGPHESYPDRKRSALVGLHRASIDEQFFAFVDPCECGGHTDTRWVSVTDAGGRGLYVRGMPLIQFSALHYTIEDLLQSDHAYSLTRTDDIQLVVDGFHMGLGGDTGWTPNVHPEFLLPPAIYRWGMELQVLGASDMPEGAMPAGNMEDSIVR